MTRLSGYFLPTEKEAPADAEAVSHKLLVRAGLVRQLGAGLWSFLPAGWRSHRRVEQMIREELDEIGAQELLLPVLQPAELWRRTGRYEIDELFKLTRQARRRAGARDDPRGAAHLARGARGPLLPRPAADPLPLPGQGAGRAPAACRAAPDARVRDEGLLHLRPRRRGPRPRLRPAHQGLRPHLRPLRPRLVSGRVGRGDDGRPRRPRVHGSVRGRRERGGALERGLRGQRRGGERGAPTGRRPARGAAGARVRGYAGRAPRSRRSRAYSAYRPAR